MVAEMRRKFNRSAAFRLLLGIMRAVCAGLCGNGLAYARRVFRQWRPPASHATLLNS
jgi:hypothetical protein